MSNLRYSLLIDCRENAIAERYKNTNDPDIQIKLLPTCDFIFTQNDIPMVCIERKRADDFASSILDGRYKTQKLEMMQYSTKYDPMPYVVYLVEGFEIQNDDDMKTTVTPQIKISKETLLSAITKTMFRDGFNVIFTRDLDDTIRWINKIWDNLKKGEFQKPSEDQAQIEYLEGLHKKCSKSISTSTLDNDPKKNWWLMSLANIDGVSIYKAQQIVKVYPSVSSLLKAYNEQCKTDIERCKLLSNIMVGERRLGDVCSGNIFKFITFVADKPTSNATNTSNASNNPKSNNRKPVAAVNSNSNVKSRTVVVKNSSSWKIQDVDECLIGSDSE